MNQTYADPFLSRTARNEMEAFVAGLRAEIGSDWGFIIDLKEDIGHALRCIYSDTGSSRILPMQRIPMNRELSWRGSAIEKDWPTLVTSLDMDDPRSFYLKRLNHLQSSGSLAMFPVKADVTVGLVSIFSFSETAEWRETYYAIVDQHLPKVVPLLQQLVWRVEQHQLDEATRFIHEAQTPPFTCQLFNRLLDIPVLLLEQVDGGSYRSVYQAGLKGGESVEKRFLFKFEASERDRFFSAVWGEITRNRGFDADQEVTCIRLDPPTRILLGLGRLKHSTQLQQDIDHYIKHLGQLIKAPEYHISTLTFLLDVQHWIKSTDRDVQALFRRITDALVDYMEAEFGTLALFDERREKLLMASQSGDLVNPLKDLPLNEETPSSIMAWVARENKPYLAEDVTRDPFYKAFDTRISTEMCVPIRLKGNIIGLVSVSGTRKKQFAMTQLGRLMFFADQIAGALYQAGVLDKAFHETEQARKLEQDLNFGFNVKTHARDLQYNFGNLVGSPTGAMSRVYDAIRRINASGRDDLNVLITGESGTGKEMVAFALHNSSPRHSKPMVVSNFASYGGDPNLIQSELFGHEKGSFSGATTRRVGCFEQADETTLFIDEVGDIVPSVQVKLLRVLQQGQPKKFQRLGGQETIRSNVRVLAATHQNLWGSVMAGKFREDLFYRLHTLVIRIPPLRERLEDIPALAAHFSARYQQGAPDIEVTWTSEAMQRLQEYNFPGNVRQLEAIINRALVMYADKGRITRDAIEMSLASEHERETVSRESLFEKASEAGDGGFWEVVCEPYRQRTITQQDLVQVVREALTATHGSYKQAARMMGVLDTEYNRFLDFLKNSKAKLDFREFRQN